MSRGDPSRSLAALAFVLGVLVAPSKAATFIVSTTADSGAGSLRQAILDANGSPGLDQITFSLPGPSFRIQPTTDMPSITDPVVIDGTTQPGYAGTPIIELSGTSAGGGASGLYISAGDSTVRGLIINRFAQIGLHLDVLGNNVIEGNIIGTDEAGTASIGNGTYGIRINAAGSNLVGGTSVGTANVVSGNGLSGILIATGLGGNQIMGNLIGVAPDGTTALGNGRAGIEIQTATFTTIGGTNDGEGNVIAFNVDGVIVAGSLGSTNNAIWANSIYSNTTLGIDLGQNGLTANDAGDGDAGVNRLQNYPVLISATNAGNTIICGTLNSTASKTFRLEFFSNRACDPSGFGQGETFIGFTNVTTDASGNVGFTATFTNSVPTNQVITATASDLGNTSEFSQCVPVVAGFFADLSLTKIAFPNPILILNNLAYSLSVTNNGPSTATGVVLTDNLPPGVLLISAVPSQGGCSSGGGVVTCNIGVMTNGGTASASIIVLPLSVAELTNIASVAANEPDPVPGNNTALVTSSANPSADLAVAKNGSPNPVAVGSNLTYSVSITNKGPSGATGVVLTDTLPAGVTYVSANSSQGGCSQLSGVVTCNLGSLSSGAVASASIVVSPITTGPITNTASVTANETDPNSANDSASAIVVVNPLADLVLALTDSPDPVFAGANLTYAVKLTNSGPSTATSITLTDTLPPGVTFVSATNNLGNCNHAAGVVTCSIASLSAGVGTVATIVVTPNSAGTITNNATVTAAEADPNSANNSTMAATTVTLSADISVNSADSPDPVTVGSNVTYTLSISNNGPSSATSLTLTNTLPAGATFVSANSSQGGCSQAGGVVTCNLGNLSSGSGATATIVVTPLAAGTITNFVVATAAEPDPASANNAAAETTFVAASADLRLGISDSPDPLAAGDMLTYVLSVTNNGLSPATGVTLTDTLPSAVAFVSANPSQGNCSEAGGIVTCAIGNLSNSAVATATIVVTPTATGTITNGASVTATEPDPASSNNSASVVTTVNPSADLSLTKSDAPDPAFHGTNVAYTLTVANGGPSPATSVTLTDTLPSGVRFVSAQSSQGNCTEASGVVTCNIGNLTNGGSATATLVIVATAPGAITNVASVVATEFDPSSGNNTATAITTVNPISDLAVAKTGPSVGVLIGSNLTYFVSVTNHGPSSASAVTLTDSLPAGVAFASADSSQGNCSEAGRVVTCAIGNLTSGTVATATIVVTTTALATITNSASVTATEADPNSGNNLAKAITLDPSPGFADLAIGKAGPSVSVLAGNTLMYFLSVTNHGPSSASGVMLSDTLPASSVFVSANSSQGNCSETAGVVTCAFGIMPNAGVATAIITVSTTTDGAITNHVSATASETDPTPANNVAFVVTTVDPAADLALSKSDAPDPVFSGNNVTYTFVVTNHGPSVATGVTLTDSLPAAVSFVSALSGQGSCTESNRLVTCTLGSLASGASASATIIVTTTSPGTITNSATVVAAEFDANTANNTAAAATTVNPPASDLSVSKTGPSVGVLVGSNVTYLVSVTNHGPSTATGVTVSDSLPPGVVLVAANAGQGPCAEVGGVVNCNLGSLASGEVATATIQVTPTADGILTNNVAVSAAETDPDLGNNSASVATTILPLADLAVSGMDWPDPLHVGSNVTYVINLTNQGPSTATGVVLTNMLPSETTFVSAAASQGTWAQTGGMLTCNLGSLHCGGSASVTIVVKPTVAGVFSNTASVSAAVADSSSANNADTISTRAGVVGVNCDLAGAWQGSISNCKGSGAKLKCLILGAFNAQNRGSATSPVSVARFYRSTDTVLDAGDVMIRERKIRPLAPGDTEFVLFGIKLPKGKHGLGQFVIAVVDATDVGPESDETNNITVFGPLDETSR